MSKGYSSDIEELRQREYPHMNNGVYLDHSGTTIYAKSVVDSFAQKMVANLYGNPHSANSPAKLSGDVVDQVRLKTLKFLGANPDDFDLIFVANATAAIKLVADSFRDLAEKTRERSFWYGYHKDAHTSIVGVRELTHGRSRCFESDEEVDAWLRYSDTTSAAGLTYNGNNNYYNNNRYHHYYQNHHAGGGAQGPGNGLGLFAYPGQSNMTGRRLPLRWAGSPRQSGHLQNTYTLLDAAALAMTAPMEAVFRDADRAPDFTCLSLYKIFGFPDLGALVVRRASGHVLTLRRYFGGGTVTMVATLGEEVWHRSKGLQAPAYRLHEGLEDGTLPFHSILALGEAIDAHARIYGSMAAVSDHTARLTARLYRGLASLRHHPGGQPLCRVYHEDHSAFGDPARQGSVVAFNVLRPDGQHVPYSDVERLADAAGIYVRSGGVCNPGGIFTLLGYEPWMTERALSAGHHCGSHGISIIHRVPTGIVRASLGAMSTKRDVDALIDFLRTTFKARAGKSPSSPAPLLSYSTTSSTLYSACSPTVNVLNLDSDGDGNGDDEYQVLNNNNNNNNNNNYSSGNFKTSAAAAAPRAFAEDVRELPRPRAAIPYHHNHHYNHQPSSSPPMTPMAMTMANNNDAMPRQFPMPLPEVMCGAYPTAR